MRLANTSRLLFALAVISTTMAVNPSVFATTYVWNKATGTQTFDNQANWGDGLSGFPNAIDAVADMSTLDITATQTVNLTQAITVGELRVGDTVGVSGTSFGRNYNNSGGNGAFVFQTSAGNARLRWGYSDANNFLRTNTTINVPLTLNSNTEFIADLQSSTSRNLYFKIGSLSGSGDFIVNAPTSGVIAIWPNIYSLDNYAGTFKYTSNGAAGNMFQLAGTAAGVRNARKATLEMSVATAGGSVWIFDDGEGASLELGALRGNGLLRPFENHAGTLRTGYLPGTNTYSGVLTSAARFNDYAGGAAAAVMNYEKWGANSTQIFSGANDYTGTTTVNEGTLLVNGTHTGGGQYTVSGPPSPDYNANGVVDAADYTLWRKSPGSYGGDPDGYNAWLAQFGNGGGTLGGTGTITASVFVNPGGVLAPGAGVGTFSVDGADIDGVLRIEYDGSLSSIDKLAVTNNLDISGASLDFDKLSVAALSGGPYIFASYGSLSGPTFASIADLPTGYSIDYNYLSANQIALVPGSGAGASIGAAGVPEPAGFLLVTIAFVGLGAVRRCRT